LAAAATMELPIPCFDFGPNVSLVMGRPKVAHLEQWDFPITPKISLINPNSSYDISKFI
jgi:hypothetical protein